MWAISSNLPQQENSQRNKKNEPPERNLWKTRTRQREESAPHRKNIEGRGQEKKKSRSKRGIRAQKNFQGLCKFKSILGGREGLQEEAHSVERGPSKAQRYRNYRLRQKGGRNGQKSLKEAKEGTPGSIVLPKKGFYERSQWGGAPVKTLFRDNSESQIGLN